MKIPKFLIGMLIGTAVGLIIWYWQKSTSAEEGALAVLDRLAAAEARVRELEGKLRLSTEQTHFPEQPEVLSGISDLWGIEKASERTTSRKDNLVEPSRSGKTEPETPSDDLQRINGIGPVFARRLKEAGILTFSDLAQQAPESLKEIVGLKSMQLADPERWIAEAQALSEA